MAFLTIRRCCALPSTAQDLLTSSSSTLLFVARVRWVNETVDDSDYKCWLDIPSLLLLRFDTNTAHTTLLDLWAFAVKPKMMMMSFYEIFQFASVLARLPPTLWFISNHMLAWKLTLSGTEKERHMVANVRRLFSSSNVLRQARKFLSLVKTAH